MRVPLTEAMACQRREAARRGGGTPQNGEQATARDTENRNSGARIDRWPWPRPLLVAGHAGPNLSSHQVGRLAGVGIGKAHRLQAELCDGSLTSG